MSTKRALLGAMFIITGFATQACRSPSTFEGRWVYRLPDRSSGENVATLRCPGTASAPASERSLPQLGDLTLRAVGAGVLEGKTDQGCTWRFEAHGARAEVTPAGQSCHNAVFDTAYTIDRWTLDLADDGGLAAEQLSATSHQPGMECAFELAKGSRVPAGDDSGASTTAGLTGSWAYGRPDPQTGANVAMVLCPDTDGAPEFQPVTGSVRFTAKGLHGLEATGDDGCTWTLEAHAGAAQLAPAPQTCTRSDGTRETRSYWAIASDGQRQQEIWRAERTAGARTCVVVIAAGERRKE
jgi:hypothetical protein